MHVNYWGSFKINSHRQNSLISMLKGLFGAPLGENYFKQFQSYFPKSRLCPSGLVLKLWVGVPLVHNYQYILSWSHYHDDYTWPRRPQGVLGEDSKLDMYNPHLSYTFYTFILCRFWIQSQCLWKYLMW